MTGHALCEVVPVVSRPSVQNADAAAKDGSAGGSFRPSALSEHSPQSSITFRKVQSEEGSPYFRLFMLRLRVSENDS